MRSTKGSLFGLILAGMMALGPVAAFAHGGGGGGHGGGGHFGGGGAGHFAGGGRFAGFTGRGFQNTQERILRGTEIISGTEEISFMEIHFSLITHTGMTIRTTATMTRMPATIPESFLPCSRS